MADSVEQRPSTPFPTEAAARPSTDAVDPLAGDWAEGLRAAAKQHGLAAPLRLTPGAEAARAAAARPPSVPPPAGGSFDAQRTEQADLRAVLALKDSLLGTGDAAHADSVEAPEAWGSADDDLGRADTVLSFALSPRASAPPPAPPAPAALASAPPASAPPASEPVAAAQTAEPATESPLASEQLDSAAAQPGSAEAAAPAEEAVLLLDEADEITELGAAPEAAFAELAAPERAGPPESAAAPEANVALESAAAAEAVAPSAAGTGEAAAAEGEGAPGSGAGSGAAEIAGAAASGSEEGSGAATGGAAAEPDITADAAFADAASLIAQAAAEAEASPGAPPLEAQHDEGVIQLDEAAAAEARHEPGVIALDEAQAAQAHETEASPEAETRPAAAGQAAPAPSDLAPWGPAAELAAAAPAGTPDPWAHAFAAAALAHEEPAVTPLPASAAEAEPQELPAEALLPPLDEAHAAAAWGVPAEAATSAGAAATSAGADGAWPVPAEGAPAQAELGGWGTHTAAAEALPSWSATPAAPVEEWAAAAQPAAKQQAWMPQGSSTYAQLESDSTAQSWAPDASRFAPLAPGAMLAGEDEPAAAEAPHRAPPVMSQAPAIISATPSRVPVMSPAQPEPASWRGPSLDLDWDSAAQQTAAHALAPGHVPVPGDEDLPVAVEDVVFTPAPPLAPHGPAVSLRVAGEHRVAIHTRAGRTRRGVVRDVDLSAPSFSLLPQGGGAPEQVLAGEVKAVFFMLPAGERPASAGGPRLRVTFVDGRSIDGNREGEVAGAGFFLVPSDAARTNTRRIYIPHEATSDVREG